MAKAKRRFVFLDYDDFKRVKFRKLEKVSDRIFVLIDKNEKKVPLKLIQQTQRLGKKIKWIVAEPDAKQGFSYITSYLMGQLHNKVHKGIEFAILSNNESFDVLVNFINDDERDCLRIKHRQKKKNNSKTKSNPSKKAEVKLPALAEEPRAFINQKQVQKQAQDTLEWLIRSGNRPAQIEMLKSYISMNNEMEEIDPQLDAIIKEMEQNQQIEVEADLIKYNF